MSDLLIVIVDANPDAWDAADAAAATAAAAASAGAAGDSAARRCTFGEFLSTFLLFASSYAAMGRRRKLAVLAHNGFRGGYVWPPPPAVRRGESDFLRPASVVAACEAALTDLREQTSEDASPPAALPPAGAAAGAKSGAAAVVKPGKAAGGGGGGAGSRLSAAHKTLARCLSLAICYHNSFKAAAPPVKTRFLVFSASPDAPAQYISVTNASYSAQRFGVVFDSVNLGPAPSVFLQQAAHVTGGMHGHPTPAEHSGLYQYLVTLFLPDAGLRGTLLLPPHHSVDLRASCFCHKWHVDVAWVCSVCLAIWCRYAPTCGMCGTEAPEGEAMGALPPAAAAAAAAAARGGGSSSSAAAVVAASGGGGAAGGALRRPSATTGTAASSTGTA